MPDLANFHSMDQFYDSRGGRFSPEWDYGVIWVEREGEHWPNWRVTWVIETGDVYAVTLGGTPHVIVLGNVPRVGEYPWPDSPGTSRPHAWNAFRDAQTIETLMEGWADDGHKPLRWVRDRLANV